MLQGIEGGIPEGIDSGLHLPHLKKGAAKGTEDAEPDDHRQPAAGQSVGLRGVELGATGVASAQEFYGALRVKHPGRAESNENAPACTVDWLRGQGYDVQPKDCPSSPPAFHEAPGAATQHCGPTWPPGWPRWSASP